MKENILVIFGGRSSEHDVSIVTAVSFLKRYFCDRYNLIPIYIDQQNNWFTGVDLCNFSFYRKMDIKKLIPVTLLHGQKILYRYSKGKLKNLYEIDFVINCCHGGSGENGELTNLFQLCNLSNTNGFGYGMGIAMNKLLSKQYFLARDILVVDYFGLDKIDWARNRIDILRQLANFDFPVVVKPNSQGSSIGVAFAENFESFEKAVNFAFKYDNSIIVERAIQNKREFNCCVMRSTKKILVSDIDEPITNKVIVSFEDKYFEGRSSSKSKKGISITNASLSNMENAKRQFPANISDKLKKQIQSISLDLYQNLGFNGVVRVDFILNSKTNKLYVGEINTIPGSLGCYFFDENEFLYDLVEGSKSFWKNQTIDLPKSEYRIFN